MQELDKLIEDLVRYFKKKEEELSNANGPTTNQVSLLALRQKEIDLFKKQVQIAETNIAHKAEVIKNFTADADKIKARIDEI